MNPASHSIACAGEALIDLIVQPNGDLKPCLGGAVYNLARALALQGVNCAYLNPLSTDQFGQLLRQGLQEAGVVALEPHACTSLTSLAIVRQDRQGKVKYELYREGVADRQTTAQGLNALSQQIPFDLVCTGCLALSPADASTYLGWLAQQKSQGRTVALDVNVRLAAMPDTTAYMNTIAQALRYADIVKVSDEDLGAMQAHFGLVGDSVTQAQQLLERIPAAMLLLTLGAQGACLFSPHAAVLRETPPAEGFTVVDTVGAGDCFFAGFLACYVHNPHDLGGALRHAVLAAAISVTRQGCAPATWDEVCALRART